ncbi:TolC family protein, partial [Flexithrix dorotheae]|uniref:TolC family protein n=1 Tax=Flexithrix dorotheae TaxID=70993 RepID=UPI00035C2DBB
YAIANSATTKNAFLDMESAEGRVRELLADGYPQINGSLALTDNFNLQTTFLPAEFFADDPSEVPDDAPPVPVKFGVRYSGNAGISARQLIFDGSFFLGVKAAKTYTELSQKQYARTKIETAEAVSKAYYGVLVTKERLELATENLGRLDSLLRQTTAMYENGFSEKLDVDRIRVNYNVSKTQVANFSRMLIVQENLLKFQIGMNVKNSLALKESLDDFTPGSIVFDKGNFDYSQRIEYSILQTQRELDQMNIKQYKVKYYPNLYLDAAFGANAGESKRGMLFDPRDGWFSYGYYGLTLQMPIFDGMRKKYQIQQAKIKAQQTENLAFNMFNTIDWEQAQAKIDWESSLSTLQAEEENMGLAQNIYNTTKIKFQEGIGQSLDIVNAETSLTDAQTNYYQALYEAMISEVEYLRSIGRLWADE